uniref:Uncharacterized protein n=1 Tax=Rhizophora mucronata TaxID=61149 RepID=A0A2P2QJK9_RHIMU
MPRSSINPSELLSPSQSYKSETPCDG